MGAMKVWDGTTWQTVAPFSERASCFVGPDAPVGTAYAGDLWWDTDDPTIAYPGAELAYNQITANVTLSATTAATAALVVDGVTRTYDGSPVVVEFFATAVGAPAGQYSVIQLWDGTTDLATQLGQVGGGSATVAALYGRRRLTPTVGSHNYRALGWVTGGNGTVYSNTAAYAPAFIRVTRV